jgi:hypothetical protein
MYEKTETYNRRCYIMNTAMGQIAFFASQYFVHSCCRGKLEQKWCQNNFLTANPLNCLLIKTT